MTGRPRSSTEAPLLTIAGLERPGFVHAFSTRALGSMRRGEQLLTPERLQFTREVGVDPAALTFAGAVHGAVVARVDGPRGVAEGCDALVTDRPDAPLFATFADCYPIVLFDPVRRAAGLVHAGWRGTAAGVASAAVGALGREYGSRPADVLAGIGPGICGRCYEVGSEVAARFEAKHLQASGSRFLLDLAAANRDTLVRAGVRPENVFVHGACTREDSRLPSHRRDADGSRFACIVALRPA